MAYWVGNGDIAALGSLHRDPVVIPRRPRLLVLFAAALCCCALAPSAAQAANWQAFNFTGRFYNEYGWCAAYGKPASATAGTAGGCQGQAATGPSPWTSGARLSLNWSASFNNDVGTVKTVTINSNGGTSAASIEGYVNTPQWERMIVQKGGIPGFPTVATGTEWSKNPGWYNAPLSVDMSYHQQWFSPKTSGYSIDLQGWLGTP
jgi:hypothetical protein